MARPSYPIDHWSYSSLIAYLRNPLAWYKRYVENVRDTPAGPASLIGRAGHKALEHFYGGIGKEEATAIGREWLRSVPDFEVDFGKAESARARRAKRAGMEAEYLQAVSFYLARPPRHRVLGVEVVATAKVRGLPLPIKAVSDLVVESKGNPGSVDIVDHKFVDSFSALGSDKPLFVLQAIFNYYTVSSAFNAKVKRFILHECKKKRNRNGASQMRKYILTYAEYADDFELFRRLINDASKDIATRKRYLPNPSDMFEGKNSFEIYRMNL